MTRIIWKKIREEVRCALPCSGFHLGTVPCGLVALRCGVCFIEWRKLTAFVVADLAVREA